MDELCGVLARLNPTSTDAVEFFMWKNKSTMSQNGIVHCQNNNNEGKCTCIAVMEYLDASNIVFATAESSFSTSEEEFFFALTILPKSRRVVYWDELYELLGWIILKALLKEMSFWWQSVVKWTVGEMRWSKWSGSLNLRQSLCLLR